MEASGAVRVDRPVAASAPVATSTAVASIAARRAARSTVVRTRPVVDGAARRLEAARGLGKAGHSGGVNHHVAARTGAAAFAAHGRFIAQRQVDDAALAAVHGVETEMLAGTLHPVGGGHRAEPQLFDAQQAVIVGIEGNARMVFARHAEHFHGDVFQRQQQFRAIVEQQVHVRTAELHGHVRRLEIVVRRRGVLNLVAQLDPAVLQGGIQKAVDAEANRGHGVLSLSQRFISCRSFLGVQWTRRQVSPSTSY